MSICQSNDLLVGLSGLLGGMHLSSLLEDALTVPDGQGNGDDAGDDAGAEQYPGSWQHG